jgi:tRNA uridine 5-carboxymethylaminomethyl modification enzyme
MHIGQNRNEGGRLGDFSARTLSQSLIDAGIELRRLKTGTPPRLLGRSIDFSKMVEQKGDEKPTFFAFYDTRQDEGLFHVEHQSEERLGWRPGCEQVSCWITHTTDRTAEIVRANLKSSALYGGHIEGVGPRYCPSIEDKFVRFADKPRHMLFLEPEGRATNEFYVNGLSTSLPFEIQQQVVQSIPGLEKAAILRPAYAVEYDFAPPTQLYPSLESKKIENLFFAGQINGTSGYEEAAAQGLVAGVNASNKVQGRGPLIIQRHEGYIGVLIDDLVFKGTNEPYRMFTSRAEHRLLFNHGSAELRLIDHAIQHNLLPQSRIYKIRFKQERVLFWTNYLEQNGNDGKTWAEAIRGGGNERILPHEFEKEHHAIRDEVIYRIRYQGYIIREKREVEKLANAEKIKLDKSLNYQLIRGLRKESTQKLSLIQPQTLGQASRISGVSPADVGILMVYLASKKGAGVP